MKKHISIGLFLLTTLSGCIGADYFDDEIIPEKIKLISDPTLALFPNDQAQVLAEYYNEYGIKESVALSWQSSNPTVAVVDNNGTITAKGTGQAIVEPYYKQFVGQEKIIVTVVINPALVATVEVSSPSSTSLLTGAKVQLTVTARNVIGTELIAKSIEWFSENETILKVSSSGQVEAVGAGIAGIHAKVAGVKSNSIDFTVSNLINIGEQIKLLSGPTLALFPNNQAQVLAEYYNEYGIKESIALSWQSSNPTVVVVDNSGTITAKGTGQAIVEPYYKQFVGKEKIIVTVVNDPALVATVEVSSPSGTSLSSGAKIQLTAIVRNVMGIDLIGKTIEWFSENETILKVSPNGQVEAVGVGIAGIHAKVEGVKSNSIDFTVSNLQGTGKQIKLLSDQTLTLFPNGQAQVLAEYYNENGVKESVALSWRSSNPTVAEVDNNGIVKAKGTGQAVIEPYYNEFAGQEKIIVTVVIDPALVATVEVSSPSSTSLSTGAKIQLTATVRNLIGTELIGKTIEWFSENQSILKVSSSGQVEAVGVGIAGVHAKVEGVKSNSIDFTVSGLVRTGTFVAAGGYKAVGTARLEIMNNELILTFSDNFDTDFALGTFIYLANSTNGSNVRASGLELGQIFTDGAKRFNISQINPNVGLNDYRYAIVLCKPATVTFGYADLK